MAKGSIKFIIILSLIASLLLGFRLGKLSNNIYNVIPSISPANTTTPIISNIRLPTISGYETIPTTPTSSLKSDKSGTSVYTDKSCGFSMTFPSSYINSQTNNGQSTIITNPDNPQDTIVTACLAAIPIPPLPTDKIESIYLDGVGAKLYHDSSSKDGSPRDEVIVTHPTNGKEIIIAGYGQIFNDSLTSFKFVK